MDWTAFIVGLAIGTLLGVMAMVIYLLWLNTQTPKAPREVWDDVLRQNAASRPESLDFPSLPVESELPGDELVGEVQEHTSPF